MKYLLPCSCGRAIAVDIGQAGQRVQCECGKSLEVPTMRGIKALAPAVKETATGPVRAASREWSPLQGWMFSIGILTAFLAGSLAGYCAYVFSQIHVHEPTVQQLEVFDKEFDRLPVDKLYTIYLDVRDHGLGTPEPPMYVVARRVRERYLRFAIIGASVAGVGMLVAGASFFVGKR